MLDLLRRDTDDRVVDTESTAVIKAYETRIRTLEENKVLCLEKIGNLGRPKTDFKKTVRTALTFLASHWEICKNGKIDMKRKVLRMVFAERRTYSPIDGVHTALTSSPIRFLSTLKDIGEAVVQCAVVSESVSVSLLGARKFPFIADYTGNSEKAVCAHNPADQNYRTSGGFASKFP